MIMSTRTALWLILVVAAGFAACENDSSSNDGARTSAQSEPASTPGKPEPNPLEHPPIDSARVPSADTAAAWVYRKELTADLNGDGATERVVIASDVMLDNGGAPLWEDGHRWALYVEPPSGKRTLLYSAFVPNGFAEAAVLAPDDKGRRRVLVQERTPQQIRSLEIEYNGEGSARGSSGAYYQLGEWLPGAARMQ